MGAPVEEDYGGLDDLASPGDGAQLGAFGTPWRPPVEPGAPKLCLNIEVCGKAAFSQRQHDGYCCSRSFYTHGLGHSEECGSHREDDGSLVLPECISLPAARSFLAEPGLKCQRLTSSVRLPNPSDFPLPETRRANAALHGTRFETIA